MVLSRLRRTVGAAIDRLQLPAAAKSELERDRRGFPGRDPGIEAVVGAAVSWLGRAQDRSASADGGVARDFSLVNGWATSYPETTGYIVPTLIEHARRTGDAAPSTRARRMLDWLVSIQFPSGAFQAGKANAEPRVPCTFNTGQILLGLAAGTAAFGEHYRDPMRRAADWLVETQDTDGCWRRFPTPFAAPGEKAYETHVAWGLLEAARLEAGRGYGEAAVRNVRWALTKQQSNGWLADCCLSDPQRPLTHTLGYALRGIVEAYRFAGEQDLLDAARRTADGLLPAAGADGSIPGQLDAAWRPAVDWVCLTGTVQIAHSWLLLYRTTRAVKYRDAAFAANAYVRRTIRIDGAPDTRGAVKGSFPVDGGYGPFQYLNWAAKFAIDANVLEAEVRADDELDLPS